MSPERCLFTLIYAPREAHEEILRKLAVPVVGEIRGSDSLDSFFYARYNEPEWQVRFRVLGRPEWIDGVVKPLVQERVAPLQDRGAIERWEFATYQREYERYGGEEGMAIAEQIFMHDTLACLELIEAERRGELQTSRREFSMVMTERTLDLMGFGEQQRLAFYKFGYKWAIDMKTWEAEELKVLDERFAALKPGIEELFFGARREDPAALWGGEEPARIGERSLAALAPVLAGLIEAQAAGRVKQDLVRLAWSYAHMHCNRLGIDPTPEAILRYFMHGLYRDRAGAPS